MTVPLSHPRYQSLQIRERLVAGVRAGITYPKGSPWREKLDLLLVKTLEDGTYEKIHTRWFGVGE